MIENMENVFNANAITSLMYAMVSTRPNIAYVNEVLCKYISTLGREHQIALKSVYQCIRGMRDYVIHCQEKPTFGKQVQVHGFVEFNCNRYVDHRRSTNGYVLNFHGGAIGWVTR